MNGKPVQYLHYAPYGELVANQMPYGIDERFKFDTGGVAKLRGMELQMRAFTPFAVVFTGKERDAETGYDNHDARYRWSVIGDWLSVDPLADKYHGISPYAYCARQALQEAESKVEDYGTSKSQVWSSGTSEAVKAVHKATDEINN